MKRLTLAPAGVALLAALAGACAGDVPSAAAPEDPGLARAPAAYTAIDIGALLGSGSSQANGVNAAGVVVGFHSPAGTSLAPFAYAGGQVVALGGGRGVAWGVSHGSPAYVAGSSAGLPVLWSLAAPAQPIPLELTAAELASEVGGQAKGVNDAGAAVGSVGARPAMWSAGGARVVDPIVTPAGFIRGEGRGINDAGHAVFQFLSDVQPIGSAYLRLASGIAVPLPPEAGDVTSYVNDISEVANDVVYVAGSTESSVLVSRAVRWTLDVASGAILATDVLSTPESHGLGVSDAGGIAGFIDIGSARHSSYLWRGTNVLKLGPPKSLKDPRAWAMSRSGQYVAGLAYAGSSSHAMRWTILSP